jgi:tetratricopeptide (TPR) repeat protein
MERLEAESLLWSKLPSDYTLDKTGSSKLLELLGYLPLAITQAAAYITENSISVEDYLKAFQAADSEMRNLLSVDLPDHRRDFEMRSEMQNSVIRTWKVSFDQIRNQNPRAAEILSLMAVLDRQGIPKMILRQDGEKETDFTTALGTLQAFSLVASEKGGENFNVHRLVHVSTQRWLELHGETAKWREAALKVLSLVFPMGDYENWATCKALSPHVQIVTRYAFAADLNVTLAKLLYYASNFAKSQGQYNFAYEMGLDALSIFKKELGSEHPDTRTGMYSPASALKHQGKYEEAEEMYRQVLELDQKALGLEHPDTRANIYSLANALHIRGKYEEAEEMYRQVLELDQKALGPEHPETLKSISMLALVLQYQGKYREAEEMQRQALELSQKVLSPEHPHTLVRISMLASVLQGQSKYKAAEEMHQQVLEQQQKLLGPEHPDTLASQVHLGKLYFDWGKYNEAEELLRQTLERREIVLGPDHPKTLTVVHILAATLDGLKQYDEASILYQRAYLKSQETLGSDHPDTQLSLKEYSNLLRKMKQI